MVGVLEGWVGGFWVCELKWGFWRNLSGLLGGVLGGVLGVWVVFEGEFVGGVKWK